MFCVLPFRVSGFRTMIYRLYGSLWHVFTSSLHQSLAQHQHSRITPILPNHFLTRVQTVRKLEFFGFLCYDQEYLGSQNNREKGNHPAVATTPSIRFINGYFISTAHAHSSTRSGYGGKRAHINRSTEIHLNRQRPLRELPLQLLVLCRRSLGGKRHRTKLRDLINSGLTQRWLLMKMCTVAET